MATVAPLSGAEVPETKRTAPGPSVAFSNGGILSLACGMGKTICALNLAARIGRKTIVVVHKEFLIHQWHERIRSFLPDARVGLIQQKKVDVEGKDIVLAMLQSLSVREYDEGVMEQFGLAVFDECHHLSSEVFSRCLPKIGSRVLLGLSATPTRKDGLTKVFKWFLGPTIFQAKRAIDGTVSPFVRVIKMDPVVAGYGSIPTTRAGTVNSAKMINSIAEFEPRTRLLAAIIAKVAVTGRQTLVLSARRRHLDDIHKTLTSPESKAFRPLDLNDVGYYVGGMNQTELQTSESCPVVLATFHMAAEGLDIKSLNTLVLATPMSSVTQAVGRILRAVSPEFPPLIIDFVDDFSIFTRQSLARRKIFSKEGFLHTKTIMADSAPEEWDITVSRQIRLIPPVNKTKPTTSDASNRVSEFDQRRILIHELFGDASSSDSD